MAAPLPRDNTIPCPRMEVFHYFSLNSVLKHQKASCSLVKMTCKFWLPQFLYKIIDDGYLFFYLFMMAYFSFQTLKSCISGNIIAQRWYEAMQSEKLSRKMACPLDKSFSVFTCPDQKKPVQKNMQCSIYIRFFSSLYFFLFSVFNRYFSIFNVEKLNFWQFFFLCALKVLGPHQVFLSQTDIC